MKKRMRKSISIGHTLRQDGLLSSALERKGRRRIREGKRGIRHMKKESLYQETLKIRSNKVSKKTKRASARKNTASRDSNPGHKCKNVADLPLRRRGWSTEMAAEDRKICFPTTELPCRVSSKLLWEHSSNRVEV